MRQRGRAVCGKKQYNTRGAGMAHVVRASRPAAGRLECRTHEWDSPQADSSRARQVVVSWYAALDLASLHPLALVDPSFAKASSSLLRELYFQPNGSPPRWNFGE